MNPFTRQQDADRNESERSGRLVFIFVWLVAVAIAGGFGFLLGVIGPKALSHIQVFNVQVFHPTPVSMAIYGMSVIGVGLTLVYIAVEIASRFDEHAPEP